MTAAPQEKYFVVRNHEDQYSIWTESLPVPKGWQIVGEASPKQDCLNFIESAWLDMRPKSVRDGTQKG
jgi:MbtH protein